MRFVQILSVPAILLSMVAAAPLESEVQKRSEKDIARSSSAIARSVEVANLPQLLPRDQLATLERRDIISDVKNILTDVLVSVNGLGPEISKLLADVDALDTEAILKDIESDLAGDLELVQKILSEVGVGVDLSGVSGLVHVIVGIVNSLVAQVDSLIADTAVGNLVTGIEAQLSAILTALGKIA